MNNALGSSEHRSHPDHRVAPASVIWKPAQSAGLGLPLLPPSPFRRPLWVGFAVVLLPVSIKLYKIRVIPEAYILYSLFGSRIQPCAGTGAKTVEMEIRGVQVGGIQTGAGLKVAAGGW